MDEVFEFVFPSCVVVVYMVSGVFMCVFQLYMSQLEAGKVATSKSDIKMCHLCVCTLHMRTVVSYHIYIEGSEKYLYVLYVKAVIHENEK